MNDRESVITHLMIIHTWAAFALENNLNFFEATHLRSIADWTDDALDLLKEKKPVRDSYGNKRCSNCGKKLQSISDPDLFCCKCGTAVKWE